MTRTATYMKACLIAGIMTLGVGAHAQERAAGSTTELQMTWSTLKNLIDNAEKRTEAVSSRVDQIVLCGKLGLTYAPSVAGADTNGCLDPHTPGGVALTTVANSVTTLTATTQTNTNNITSIINCNKQSKVYNGASCVAPAATGFTSIDMNACTFLSWRGSTTDLVCPANSVIAKARTHRTDSAEWDGFWCCPLK